MKQKKPGRKAASFFLVYLFCSTCLWLLSLFWVVIITVFVVIAELSFLAGIYVLGRELAGKYRAYFNPLNWFRKRKPIAEKEEESSHSE